MKKLIAIVTSLLILSTSSFASVVGVQRTFVQLEKDVTISNVSRDEAVKNAFSQLLKSGVTAADIQEYVKLNASSADYAIFSEMVELAQEELSQSGEINSSQLNFMMTQAVDMVSVNGSHYEGCPGTQAAGGVLLAGAFVMGMLALHYSGYTGTYERCGTFSCSYSDDDAALGLGIGSMFAFFLSIPLFAVDC